LARAGDRRGERIVTVALPAKGCPVREAVREQWRAITSASDRVLRSDLVVLAPVTRADSAQLFQWINERDDVVLSAAYKPVADVHHDAWLEGILARKDAFIFGIRDARTSALVGSCQLHGVNPVHRNAELQIRIGAKSERGKGLGFGQDATRLLLRFAFDDLNLERVSLHVFSNNEHAIKMYERVGFVREGLLRRGAHVNGAYVDVIIMGILKQEYRRS
jgi:RimJ/RimL family protein N-acetyltransferase